MLPLPAEDILPMVGLSILRLGLPLLVVLLLGALAQRFEQAQV